jgi:hypothetical protein
VALSPTERKIARTLIRRYCERSEAAQAKIHYSQARPYTHLGVAPGKEFTCDCSGFATGAFFWADKFTSFKVQDPNGQSYVHYPSYTGTLLANNRKRRVPLDRKFFIGDFGLYGDRDDNGVMITRHVVICRKNGDEDDAIWTSHGWEGGPDPVRLHYRKDLLVVVRSEDLA